MSAVGPEPARLVCPNCHLTVITRIECKSTMHTHLIALIMCLIGCCPCAACLYCTDCARSVEHYCSHCDAYVATYDR